MLVLKAVGFCHAIINFTALSVRLIVILFNCEMEATVVLTEHSQHLLFFFFNGAKRKGAIIGANDKKHILLVCSLTKKISLTREVTLHCGKWRVTLTLVVISKTSMI